MTHRKTPRTSLALLLGLCVLAACAGTPPADPSWVRLGAGEQRYAWVPNWLEVPGGGDLGNTHGEIVVDADGLLHLNTDTARAIMVYRQDGSFVRAWGEEFANGLHGMTLAWEGDRQVLWFTHFNRHEVVKASLDGEVLWRGGAPMQSGVYENPEQFRPTSVAVAPDGRVFVADGYGRNVVHRLAPDGTWLGSFGGHGSEPGQFATPHGIHVDTRGEVPEVIVADRENHRLQRFDLEGNSLGVIEGMLRRPCKIQQHGQFLVVPDLAGRVTVLDGNNLLVTQLGDNPDPALRAVNGVPREKWNDGEFLAPHSAAWDGDGNLYVMDWNAHGRITKLQRLP
jgi:hypothetical protein